MTNKMLGRLILAVLMVTMVASLSFAQEKKEVVSLLEKEAYIPDIGTFLQIGGNIPAGYSWDGKDVFFRSSMSGASQIYRITEEAWPYQLTTFEDGIDFFTLSHSAKMAIVGASVGGSEQSQLYLVDAMTGRVIPLIDPSDARYGSVVWACGGGTPADSCPGKPGHLSSGL